MRVRLLKKLANALNNTDLSNCAIGDIFDLPPAAARMLVAEGWAEIVDQRATPGGRRASDQQQDTPPQSTPPEDPFRRRPVIS